MNFGDLKTDILSLIGRAPNTVVYDLVIADVNADVRIPEMMASTSVTEAASVSTGVSNLLEIQAAWRDTTEAWPLTVTSLDAIKAEYSSSGNPTQVAHLDGTLYFNAPGNSETVQIRYYAALSEFSSDADENDVLTKFPAVFVYGALAHHGDLIGDSRAPAWRSIYEREVRKANRYGTKNRFGGAPLRPTPRVVD